MKKVIVIVGPTGVGKTKLAIKLAKKLNGEIINADSTQIYECLDIATAKVKEEEKEGVVHHLIDIRNIDEDFSVFDYQKECRAKIDDILGRGKTVFIVGGTGLYIKAALYDYQFKSNNIQEQYENLSNQELYEKLLKIDSNISIHVNNRRRIVKALNYYYENNQLLSTKEKTDKLLYDVAFIGLTTERELLYEKINNRVDMMIENGLVEEAKKIYNLKIRSKAVITPIGYKEMFDYFENKTTLIDTIQLIKKRSRNYAKRQYTWFKNQFPINWFEINDKNFNKTIDEVLKFIKKFIK